MQKDHTFSHSQYVRWWFATQVVPVFICELATMELGGIWMFMALKNNIWNTQQRFLRNSALVILNYSRKSLLTLKYVLPKKYNKWNHSEVYVQGQFLYFFTWTLFFPFFCVSKWNWRWLFKSCTAFIESTVSSKGKVNLLKVLAFLTDRHWLLFQMTDKVKKNMLTDVFVKEQVPFCSSFIYVKHTFFKHHIHLGSPSQCSNNHQLWCKVLNLGFNFTKPNLVIVGIVENLTRVV